MYKAITITQRNGKTHEMLIDTDDFDKYCIQRWSIDKDGYAIGWWGGKMKKLHRLIIDCPTGMQVDHINGNILDNRKANLRACTPSQNAANRRIKPRNSSGYIGVSATPSGRFRAMVRIGKNQHLGTFDTADEAAYVYDQVILQLNGVFSRPNLLKVTP